MLHTLQQVEAELPELLKDETQWQGLYVDYHPPLVERLWRQWGGYRIYLHRIHPCALGEALFHPHPWPSAMLVVSGAYEMAIGYGTGEEIPPIAACLILGPGSRYEMTNPDSWHYVRPIDGVTESVMVTGPLWNRPSPKSKKLLRELTVAERKAIFESFKNHFPNR